MPERLEGAIPPPENLEIIKRVAEENFSKWHDALLKTENPKKIAAIYAEGATFLPTVSEEFKKGQSGAEEYFKHFLEKNPTGEIIQEEIQNLGDDCYLHTGLYNFEAGPNNDRQIVEAKFTFIWKKNNQNNQEEWLIDHHDSAPLEAKNESAESAH